MELDKSRFTHNLHRTEDGMWMFETKDGVWTPFMHDRHFIDTRERGAEFPIAFFKKVCVLPR